MADQYEDQLPVVSDAKWIRCMDASGNPFKMSKEDLATVLGGLMTTNEIFPFMYRGRITDANLATETGYYEIFGEISNVPFSQSWGPLLVFGKNYKVQIAAASVSDSFKLYTRQLGSNIGWKGITLT